MSLGKLMRQAANILPSASAMQIHQLEAYQAMPKSANSKVIFMPTQNVNLNNQFGTGAPGVSTSHVSPNNSGKTSDPHDRTIQDVLNSHIAAET